MLNIERTLKSHIFYERPKMALGNQVLISAYPAFNHFLKYARHLNN